MMRTESVKALAALSFGLSPTRRRGRLQRFDSTLPLRPRILVSEDAPAYMKSVLIQLPNREIERGGEGHPSEVGKEEIGRSPVQRPRSDGKGHDREPKDDDVDQR